MLEHVPSTWAATRLDCLTVLVLGGDWGKSADYEDPDYVLVRCIRASELGNWGSNSGSTAALRKIKKSSLAARELRIGDIIVEVSGGGPAQPVGRSALIDSTALATDPEHPKICTNFFRLLRPSQEMNSAFLNLYLQFFYHTGWITAYQGGSNNIRNLRFKDYLTITIPVPPSSEQFRIVAKIEELCSELDKGIESLKKARAQLATYRQAVLKHAFEGKLTAQWREENKDRVETPEQLLTRVKKELVERYEQQLREWKSAVKVWEKNGDRDKKPLEPRNRPSVWNVDAGDTNLDESFDLPDSWIIVRYGEICSVVRNGTSAKPSGTSGYRIARISAVRPMAFDYDDYRLLQCDDVLAKNYTLQANDLVFTRYNGSRRFVGVCARFDGREERLFPDKLIKTRPNLPCLSSRFLEAALNVGLSRAFLETKIRTTAGQSGISGSDIRATPIPVTSLPEQQEVVSRLDTAFEAIERTERTVAEALQQADSVRHAILKIAFSGQLVAQDPNDEPASILMDRIRAEREQVTRRAIRRTAGKRRAVKATA